MGESHGPTLEQMLCQVAAETGIQLNAARLRPTLVNALPFHVAVAPAANLEISIDATSADSLMLAAAHLREIADKVEAAASARGHI